MELTYLGHNTLYIESKGKHLLVDPAVSINPLAQKVDLMNRPVDYILLTHGHGDHVADVDKVYEHFQPTIISNYEVASYYGTKGYNHHAMNHGGRKSFDFGHIALTNAIHSSVLPDGTYGGNPVGFIIYTSDKCIYIAGDTALTYDMKLIPELYPPVDLAILPIGDNFTMGAEDAALAAKFVGAKKVMGCHFDSFDPISIDHKRTFALFADMDVDFILPAIEQQVTV